MRQHHDAVEVPEPVPLESPVAEPMRRALAGESGTMRGLDYRGDLVLAAYEPVGELGLGIVTKIDVAEMRAPFVRASNWSALGALLLALLAVLMLVRLSNPVIAHLERQADELTAEIYAREEAPPVWGSSRPPRTAASSQPCSSNPKSRWPSRSSSGCAAGYLGPSLRCKTASRG